MRSPYIPELHHNTSHRVLIFCTDSTVQVQSICIIFNCCTYTNVTNITSGQWSQYGEQAGQRASQRHDHPLLACAHTHTNPHRFSRCASGHSLVEDANARVIILTFSVMPRTRTIDATESCTGLTVFGNAVPTAPIHVSIKVGGYPRHTDRTIRVSSAVASLPADSNASVMSKDISARSRCG